MSAAGLGRCRWAIAEGCLPSGGRAYGRALSSHEAVCILNAGGRDATIAITVYFADREPVGPFRLVVSARRTLHLRFDDLVDPEPIPRSVDFSSVIQSDQPIVIQHTRLDSRKPGHALMTTIAYSE